MSPTQEAPGIHVDVGLTGEFSLPDRARTGLRGCESGRPRRKLVVHSLPATCIREPYKPGNLPYHCARETVAVCCYRSFRSSIERQIAYVAAEPDTGVLRHRPGCACRLGAWKSLSALPRSKGDHLPERQPVCNHPIGRSPRRSHACLGRNASAHRILLALAGTADLRSSLREIAAQALLPSAPALLPAQQRVEVRCWQAKAPAPPSCVTVQNLCIL